MNNIEDNIPTVTLHCSNQDRMTEEPSVSSKRRIVMRDRDHNNVLNEDDDVDIEKNSDQISNIRNRCVENNPSESISKYYYIACLALLLILVSLIFTGIGIAEKMRRNSAITNSGIDANEATYSPSQAPSSEYEKLFNLAFSGMFGDGLTFQQGSSQWKSRMWMIHNDPVKFDLFSEDSLDCIIQRFVLITVYFAFGGETTNGIDWLVKHECDSELIRCDDNSKVRSLLLGKLH